MAAQIDPRARLAFGPFELNVSTGELSKSGVRVRLSGQPMEILTILLAHAGEIVTREQLREHVWSEGTFVDFDGGLNAAMAKLRRALEDSAQHPRYIETIPGRGYRFLCRVEHLNPISQTAPVAQPELEPASAPHQMRGRTINFWRWVEIVVVCALLTAAILRFYKALPSRRPSEDSPAGLVYAGRSFALSEPYRRISLGTAPCCKVPEVALPYRANRANPAASLDKAPPFLEAAPGSRARPKC